MTNQLDFITTINGNNFENIALEIFKKQYTENSIYNSYVNALKVFPDTITSIQNIPFLPISFFRSHAVICGSDIPALYFESSSTTSEQASRHYILDAGIYEDALLKGFKEFYGDPGQYVILALLPSYLERKNASLVYMADLLMKNSQHPSNGFYLNEWDKLQTTLAKLEMQKQKTILLGVTFALLDFAEQHEMDLRHTIVMETGGMKGRKEERTREEVHRTLKQKWNLQEVHSEYGMTELLSQAYSKKQGLFYPTATMRVLIRDMNDPFEIKTSGIGYVNVIDIANVNSCSFIATDDIGKLNPDGSFEVLGRMDHSILRGCSLMTA